MTVDRAELTANGAALFANGSPLQAIGSKRLDPDFIERRRCRRLCRTALTFPVTGGRAHP